MESFKTIDMFYDVYNLRKSELNYVNKGIKYIKAIVRPDFDVKIPLEIIFKIIHATQENPLVKYNPSSRQENVYRLFADKIATDGRKIPYLKKASVFKLMKNIGRGKSVAVYIESTSNGDIQSLIISLRDCAKVIRKKNNIVFDQNIYDTDLQTELLKNLNTLNHIL